MADDGQTAEVLDDKTDMGEASIGYPEDRKDAEILPEVGQAIPSETLNLASEEDEQHILGADALRTHTQIELDHVEYIGDYFDALIHSPSNIRKKQLDADTDKLNSEIEGLQQKADKIIEDKKLREKADEVLRISGEGALEVLLNSTTKNIDKNEKESAKAEIYTELLNISLNIKKTLEKDYATDDQPFQLADDDSFPDTDILPALALHLYEDGNIQSVEDLAVISSQEGIEAITATIVASHKAAIVEEQNKKSRRLKKLRGDITKKSDEIARKNEEKQEITQETIHEERAEFLRTRPDFRNSLNTLGHYKRSLDIAIKEPSAEAYFADNEDVLAVFSHMDSELGDDADAIALKRNDDRKRYFITLKNLNEERFNELVTQAQQDIVKLREIREKEEPEENPLRTEKDFDVADLIDQDRNAISQDYIPNFETLDKLVEAVNLNTTAPKQKTGTTDTNESDENSDVQEEIAPVNYTSFTQHKQRAEHAVASLKKSLASNEQREYENLLARIEERGIEDATEDMLQRIESQKETLERNAVSANQKLSELRPDNIHMLRRANVMGAALAFADETDADNHFKNAENSQIIDVLNKKIESTDNDEQKGEYETLKKMMVAARSVDAYQAEKGSPISIMQNLRDDVENLRANAEEKGEEADITDEKIVDAVRGHMDAMVENYLPTDKQLKKAQKTTLANRVKALISRATKTRNKVKKERIEPTISEEEMDAAIDKLVADPENDYKDGAKSDNTPEDSANKDDHDEILFAEAADDLLDPEPAKSADSNEPDTEELGNEDDPFDLFEEQDADPEQPDLPFEDEEEAANSDEQDGDEPIDAEYEEVEETEDADRHDEPEVETPENKEKPSMLASFAAASTGAVATVAIMAATLGLEQDIGTYAFGAVGGGVAAIALINGLRNDPTKTILTVGSTIAISLLAKGALLGAAAAIPFVPGIVATMGVFAVASAIGGMGATIVGNLLEKARGNDVSLLDGAGKNMLRGAAFGAFAGALGFAFAGDGADNALAFGQNADITVNGAENADLGDGPDTSLEQTLIPDPAETKLEPSAGGNNDLAGDADLTEVSAPDFGNMSAIEIREAAGVMYTQGDYQGALDALNVALEKSPDWLDESIKGDIANIAMVHGLDTGVAGAENAETLLRDAFIEAGQEEHGRNEDYLRMLMEKRDLLSPSGPPMS